MSFDGNTFDEERDGDRLRKQLEAVKNLVVGTGWWTLREIAAGVRSPEASVSARLRDLRKGKFRSYTVERRYAGRGLWEYRVNRVSA